MARKGMSKGTAVVLLCATVTGLALATWLTSGDASESYDIRGGSVSSIAVDEPTTQDFGSAEPTDATSASDAPVCFQPAESDPTPPACRAVFREGNTTHFDYHDGAWWVTQDSSYPTGAQLARMR